VNESNSSVFAQISAFLSASDSNQGEFSQIRDLLSFPAPNVQCSQKKGILGALHHTSGLANYSGLTEYNQRFAYNNSGYFLLGMIVERITGLTFEHFLNENILVPLGMENTGIDNNKTVVAKMSSSYHSTWEDFIQCEYMDMSSSFSAGAMYSTVDDLYKWDQALYSETLVSKATLDLIFNPNPYNYGFRWFIDKRYNRRRVHHGGAYRGFRSELHRYPDEHTTVIMLTNYDFVPVLKLAESLTGVLFGEHVPVPTRPQPYPLDELIYADYMGTYEGYGFEN
jgi:CubicO group peptidase (beta-lactamase class C family)